MSVRLPGKHRLSARRACHEFNHLPITELAYQARGNHSPDCRDRGISASGDSCYPCSTTGNDMEAASHHSLLALLSVILIFAGSMLILTSISITLVFFIWFT